MRDRGTRVGRQPCDSPLCLGHKDVGGEHRRGDARSTRRGYPPRHRARSGTARAARTPRRGASSAPTRAAPTRRCHMGRRRGPARDRTVHCSIALNAPRANADGGSPHHGGGFLAVGKNPEEEVMQNRNKWIAKAAALVGLVGGLAGTADATMLSAGGFPSYQFSQFTGTAYCVLTN